MFLKKKLFLGLCALSICTIPLWGQNAIASEDKNNLKNYPKHTILLPLNMDLKIGSSISINDGLNFAKEISQLKSDNITKYLTDLTQTIYNSPIYNAFNKSNGLSIKEFANYNLVGYSGSLPISFLNEPNLPINVSLGVNQALVTGVTVSNGFNDLLKNFPDILTNGADLMTQLPQVSTNLQNNLSNTLNKSAQDVQNVLTSLQNININNLTSTSSIDAMIDTINQTITTVDNLEKNLNNDINSSLKPLLDDVDKITKALAPVEQGNQFIDLKAAGDGHIVLKFGTNANLYENDLFNINLNTNLKFLYMPQVINFPSLIGQLDSNNKGLTMSIPTAVITRLEIDKLSSISNTQNTIQAIPNSITKSISNISKTTKQDLNNVKSDLEQLKSIVNNPVELLTTGPTLLNKIQTDVTTAINNLSGLSSSQEIQNVVNSNTQNIQNLQKTIVNDLNKNITGKIIEVAQIGPGVSLDLGISSFIDNKFLVGLSINNLTYWPATVRESTWTLKVSDDFKNVGINASDLIYKSINYTYSHPLGINLSGSMFLDSLIHLDHLKNTTLTLNLEQVFEDPKRDLALNILLQKFWGKWYVNLGGQIGGLGNLAAIGAGYVSLPASFHIRYGATNPINLFNSNAAILNLTTQWMF